MTVLRWVVAVALLAALGWATAPHAAALAPRLGAFRWEWGAAATALMLLAHFLAAERWRRALAALGHPLGYGDAFVGLHLAAPAKYLPGGAWHYMGRTAWLAARGVPAGAAAASQLLDDGLAVGAALAVGGGCWLAAFEPAWGLGAAAIATAAMAVAVHRRAGGAWRLTATHLAAWALQAAAFVAFAQAWLEAPLTGAEGLRLAGAAPLAWAAGFLAVIAPAGLGVREACLVGLLAPAFPAGWPALVALAARVWGMLVEGVMLALAASRRSAAPPGGR